MHTDSSSSSNGAEIRRSPQLARLLREAQPPEVLPWARAVDLIAAAPPARASIFDLLGANQTLRFASGLAACLVVLAGALAVLPAQARHVGTVISTQLPAAWKPGSAQVAEFKTAAQQRFGALGLPDSQLYLLSVAHDNGQPELAVVLQNVDSADAEAFYNDLAKSYPALAADSLQRRIEDVDGESPGSLLSVALAGALAPSHLSRLSEGDARIAVLKAIDSMGLTPTEVSTSRRSDGTLVVNISADMQIPVVGHTQEDLNRRGLSRDTLGERGFEELLKAAQ